MESWDDAVLTSLGAYAMDHIPDEDGPAVANTTHAVRNGAIYADVFVGASRPEGQRSFVAANRTVTSGSQPAGTGTGDHRWLS